MANVRDEIQVITKRDGRTATFDREKIVTAIMKAAQSVAGTDREVAQSLTDQVMDRLRQVVDGDGPSVEMTQDIIEKVLIENGHARTAKAFILYRAKRSRIRDGKSELMDLVADIVEPDEEPGPVASRPLSVGLAASRAFSLNRLLPERDADAHQRGLWHVHDLALFGQIARSLVLTPATMFQCGLRVGPLPLTRPTTLEQAVEWLHHLMAQAKELGYAHTTLHHLDQALAPFATSADDDQLHRCLVSLLLSCNAGAMPGRIHVRVSDTADAVAQRVALTLLSAWSALQTQAVAAIQPRLVLEWSRPFTDARHDARLVEAARLAARWGNIAFEKGLACDGYSASALLSLNVPRVALEARAKQQSLADALYDALTHARTLFANQRRRVRSQAERNPLAAFNVAPRPAAVALVGIAQALVAGSEDGLPLATYALFAQDALAQTTTRLARPAAPDDPGLVLTNYLAGPVAESFARRDRREFGILRGVTDMARYSANLATVSSLTADAHLLPVIGQMGHHLSGGQFVTIALNPELTDAALLEGLAQVWASGAHGLEVQGAEHRIRL